MKADTLSLSQLFNRPVSYVVPLFQRPYVWNKGEHWLPLWEDFRTVAERLMVERGAADRMTKSSPHCPSSAPRRISSVLSS